MGKGVSAQNYQGYRIGLFNFEWVGKKKKTLRCSAVNTGRERLSFDKNTAAPQSLIVEVDTISLPEELMEKRDWVRLALLQKEVILEPGQMLSKLDLSIKVPSKPEVSAPKEKQAAEVQKDIARAAPPEKEEPAKKQEPQFFDYQNSCPDLVFDSVWVVSIGKKDMTLAFIVHNQGQKPAKITGKKRKESDNVAVNIYFVSGTRLTRGALLADGIFIGESKDNPSGILAAGARMGGTITVDTEKRTKFSPNVLFELDPFYSILECDETNNTVGLEVAYE